MVQVRRGCADVMDRPVLRDHWDLEDTQVFLSSSENSNVKVF